MSAGTSSSTGNHAQSGHLSVLSSSLEASPPRVRGLGDGGGNGGWGKGGSGGGAGRGGELGTDTPASPCGASRAASAAMAGSEPRSGGVTRQPHHSDWGRLEAAFLSGWRNFWQSVGKERAAPRSSPEEADEEASSLTRLPVSVGRHPRRTAGRAGRGARRGGLWGPRRRGGGSLPGLGLCLVPSLQPFRAVSSPGGSS